MYTGDSVRESPLQYASLWGIRNKIPFTVDIQGSPIGIILWQIFTERCSFTSYLRLSGSSYH